MPVAVTLELREVTTEDLRGSPVSSDGDLIPPLALVAEMLSTVTALFAVLLDGEALSSPEGRRAQPHGLTHTSERRTSSVSTAGSGANRGPSPAPCSSGTCSTTLSKHRSGADFP